MCHIIGCDMVVAVGASLSGEDRPLAAVVSSTHSQSEERQGFSLLRGSMSVTVSGSQLSEQTCLHLRCQTLSMALYSRSGTLAGGAGVLFPSRKHTSVARVKVF